MLIKIGDYKFLRLAAFDWMLSPKKGSLESYLQKELGVKITVTNQQVALNNSMVEVDEEEWTLFLLKRQNTSPL